MSPRRSRGVGIALGLSPLVAAFLVAGCFYDSSWAARKTAEVHNAARAKPAALPSSNRDANEDAPAAAGGVTTLRVRVHATAAYAAQTPDWKAHVRAIVDDASASLEASVGARLVMVSAEPWDATAHPRLDGDLAALRAEDTGDDADLVLGLVGGLPITTPDFEQAGLSLMGGRYIVERAPNVADEYEAVAKAFDQLGEDDRARLRRERVHHREVAVLLHEIGHTLGAGHQEIAGSLMRPAYDPKMAGFDPATLAVMRAGLARRGRVDEGPPTGGDGRAAAGTTVSAAPLALANVPSELRAEDRNAWARVSGLLGAGDAEGAWVAGTGLFAAYPGSYAVQDLRCKVAMGYFGTFDRVKAECDALMRIATNGVGVGAAKKK